MRILKNYSHMHIFAWLSCAIEFIENGLNAAYMDACMHNLLFSALVVLFGEPHPHKTLRKGLRLQFYWWFSPPEGLESVPPPEVLVENGWSSHKRVRKFGMSYAFKRY